MTVFKTYFKIVRSYIPMIIIYTVIFSFFAVVATRSNPVKEVFVESKPNVAIINNDNNALLTEAFLKFIDENTKVVKVDEKNLKDALFYREVDLVITIPANFSANLLNNEQPIIDLQRVPDSYDSTYGTMLLNRFLNIVQAYIKVGISEEELVKLVFDDFKINTNVELINEQESKNLYNVNYFYNFSNYTILSISIMVVAMIMNSFRNSIIKKRNVVSPISYKKLNKSLFLGNLTLMFLIWFIYCSIANIIYKIDLFSISNLLFMLNLLVFSFTTLSIGFLVGNLISSKEAISGIVNVVALGSSFICGAFVPQVLLGQTVINLSRIFPSYWFIKNNDLISLLTVFDFDSLKPIFINMSVVIIFAFIFIIINSIITRIMLKDN